MHLMTDKESHRGHRKRLKRRYIEALGEGFCDHELLELLLFYAIPRRNTNEISHRLMERFGSIERIVEASPDELTKVDGIGNNSAVLIHLTLSLAKRYALEFKAENPRLNTLDKLVNYARSSFVGATGEKVYLYFLDNSLRLVDARLIAVGAIDEVKVLVRNVMELALLKRVSAVAIAHNHTGAGVEESLADVEFTMLLQRELELIGIRLVEHVIINKNDYNAILLKHKKELLPDDRLVDMSKFYE